MAPWDRTVVTVRTDCGVMEWSKGEKLGGDEVAILEKVRFWTKPLVGSPWCLLHSPGLNLGPLATSKWTIKCKQNDMSDPCLSDKCGPILAQRGPGF